MIERDFWLVEHSERISDTVSGLAFTGLTTIAARGRETLQTAIDRQKEITTRFVHYAANLQALGLEYRPDMTEGELRAWAASVHSALHE